MRRADRSLPSAFTLLSCAGGASPLVGESSFNRTPETTRTVALASATTIGTVGLVAGVPAATAAAANKSMTSTGNALRSYG